MSIEERQRRAIEISNERILTQNDFEKLKMVQMKKRIQDRKKILKDLHDDDDQSSNLIQTKKRKFISIENDSESDEPNSSKQYSNEFDFCFLSRRKLMIFLFLFFLAQILFL